MKVLLVDHDDSFTHNVRDLIILAGRDIGERADVEVARARSLWTPSTVELSQYQATVLSPGGGHPREAAASLKLVAKARAERRPMFGVCLGHQIIACCYGARIQSAPVLRHGETVDVSASSAAMFAGAPRSFRAMRYNSLTVAPDSVVEPLEVTACSTEGDVMALAAHDAPICSVQFHPESFASEQGRRILGNFLCLAADSVKCPV